MTEKEVRKIVYTILDKVFTYAEYETHNRTFVNEAFELLSNYTSEELDEIRYQEELDKIRYQEEMEDEE